MSTLKQLYDYLKAYDGEIPHKFTFRGRQLQTNFSRMYIPMRLPEIWSIGTESNPNGIDIEGYIGGNGLCYQGIFYTDFEWNE